MCVFIPPTMHRAGSTHRPMKASIFQPRSVRQGRTNQENRGQYDAQDNLTNENPNHQASSILLALITISSNFDCSAGASYFFFARSANVADESLIWSSVSLPLYAGIFLPLPLVMLSVNCASVCFCTRPANVRSRAQFFPHVVATATIRCMARGALRLVNARRIVRSSGYRRSKYSCVSARTAFSQFEALNDSCSLSSLGKS